MRARIRTIRELAILLVFVLVGSIPKACANELTEDVRMLEYNARNYTWPPKMIPETPGWHNLMMRRFRQLEFVKDSDQRYNGYFHHVNSAYVAPNFTENGWGLTKAPANLVDELRQALKIGMDTGPGLEGRDDALGAIEIGSKESHPLFVDTSTLNEKILMELKSFHEEWAGVPLIAANAYDHDNDGEPWPIVIEDFQGNTNEVMLESGDMLFYESSKCVHGRPKRFNGKWYSSVFLHYYPTDWNVDERNMEGHYGVPEHWNTDPPSEEEMDAEPLEIIETCLRESACRNNWCALENSIQWHGPATYGEVLTTGGVTFPLRAAYEKEHHPNENEEL